MRDKSQLEKKGWTYQDENCIGIQKDNSLKLLLNFQIKQILQKMKQTNITWIENFI